MGRSLFCCDHFGWQHDLNEQLVRCSPLGVGDKAGPDNCWQTATVIFPFRHRSDLAVPYKVRPPS